MAVRGLSRRSAGLLVTLQLPAECCGADPQLLRGHGLAPVIALEHRQDVIALDIAERSNVFGLDR
jgi:hypothetical protein